MKRIEKILCSSLLVLFLLAGTGCAGEDSSDVVVDSTPPEPAAPAAQVGVVSRTATGFNL